MVILEYQSTRGTVHLAQPVGASDPLHSSPQPPALARDRYFSLYATLFEGLKRQEVAQFLALLSTHGGHLASGTAWCALLCFEDRNFKKPLAGALLTLPVSPRQTPSTSEIASSTPSSSASSARPVFSALGFLGLSATAPSEAASAILTHAEQIAREHGSPEIRTPLDFNFFYGYRMILPHPNPEKTAGGEAPRFYGEPEVDPRWNDCLQSQGYSLCRTWQSHRLETPVVKKQMAAISNRFWPIAQEAGFTLRPARLTPRSAWLDDLKRTHELLLSSYRDMPEFEGISWPSFLSRFDSFRHLLSLPTVWFLEDRDHRCEGFLIGFFDPAPVLRTYQKLPRLLRPLATPWLLWKLHHPQGRNLLVTYAGKAPDCSPAQPVGSAPRSEVKGVIGILFHEMLKHLPPEIPAIYSVFLATDSPSWKSMPQDYTVIREYGLFSKRLL